MKVKSVNLNEEYDEIKKGELIEKNEADTLLRHWIKDQVEYYVRNKPNVTDERLADEIFDIMVDHWIGQPLLLAACRAVDFDKNWIVEKLEEFKAEILEELKEETLDILQDKVDVANAPQSRGLVPLGGFGHLNEPTPPAEDDGRAVSTGLMAYSITTLDDEVGEVKKAKPKKKKAKNLLEQI